jgi:hypothetical protein
MQKKPISLEKIIQEGKPAINSVFVLAPLIEELPINDLPWETFEAICCDLLIAEKDPNEVEGFQVYGGRGQKQEGIDIVGINSKSWKNVVAQSKRHKVTSPSELETIVDEFLTGAYADTTELFILCITVAINKKATLVKAWQKSIRKLKDKDIKAELWDSTEIQKKLRLSPRITEIYFGPQIAEKYCNSLPGENIYPFTYATKSITDSERETIIENHRVKGHFYLPREENIFTGALFHFCRADLNGISLEISSQILVNFMQERAHVSSIIQTSFVNKFAKEKRFVLSFPKARLVLNKDELSDFDWIICRVWDRYIGKATKLEKLWNNLLFPRVENSNSNNLVVNLYKVPRWFWNEIINYTSKHDSEKCNHNEFIFEPSNGCIKVFVGEDTSTLDRGYHAILYPEKSTAINSDMISIQWSPLQGISGAPIELSKRKAWDAKLTHDWLESELFPNVCSWINSELKRKEKSKIKKIRNIFAPSEAKVSQQLKRDSHSCVLRSSKYTASCISDNRSLMELLNILQSHFYSYQRNAEIETALTKNVLGLCKRLSENIISFSSPTIKSTLQLSTENVHEGIKDLLENDSSRILPFATWLDYSLRCLIEICKNSPQLGDHELSKAIDLLDSTCNRFNEDQICMSFY